MLNGLSLPIICATNLCACAQWFVHLEKIIHHPLLQADEKILWIWLATQCANNPSFSHSLSYEQIARAMNKPTRGIHRILFRLKIMGLLEGAIPIWYGEPTVEMVQEVRTIKLIMPPKAVFENECSGMVLPRRTAPVTQLNLLNGYVSRKELKRAHWKDYLGFSIYLCKRLCMKFKRPSP